MTENILAKLFEHNNWANTQIMRACSALTDEQLDAEPDSATKGTIRLTLWHIVSSQQGYLSLLTGIKRRTDWQAPPPFAELQEAADASGEALLDLARAGPGDFPGDRIRTNDGYSVEPWVVMVQVINHATEHREQIKSMLSSLGVTPPVVDSWTFGEDTGALSPLEA